MNKIDPTMDINLKRVALANIEGLIFLYLTVGIYLTTQFLTVQGYLPSNPMEYLASSRISNILVCWFWGFTMHVLAISIVIIMVAFIWMAVMTIHDTVQSYGQGSRSSQNTSPR